MKNIMLRQVLVCACLVSSPLVAMAEDSWTGGYVGVQYGSVDDSTSLAWAPNSKSQLFAVNGSMYGAHLGYDFAVSDHMLLGGELQYSHSSNVEGQGLCPITSWTCGGILHDLSSLRGRVGYGNGGLLLYADVGYGTAAFEAYDSNSGSGRFGRTEQLDGLVDGVGIALRMTSSVSLRAEYSRYYFGKEQYRVDSGSRVSVNYQPTATTFSIDWHF